MVTKCHVTSSDMKTDLGLLAADVVTRQHTRSYGCSQHTDRHQQIHHIHGLARLE